MAVEKKTKTNNKKATTKKVDKKETKPVEKEIVKTMEVKETPAVEKVKEKKTGAQLRRSIKKDAKDITVYIINLSSGHVKFTHEGSVIFDLKDEGAETDVTLDEFAILKNGHRGYFEKHLIAITDIECECDYEYEIEDILDYLGVSEVYDNIENYDIDYIKYILTKMDNYDLEKLLGTCDNALAERIADRAVKMHKKGKLDSIKKQTLIAKRIGLEKLID